jgi:hypothetical protein
MISTFATTLPSWTSSCHLSLFIHSSLALQLFVGPWPLFHFRNLIHSKIPWTADQSVVKPLPTHRINAQRHPCLEWDLNPWFQRSSERKQFMPYTTRPLWSASVTIIRLISILLLLSHINILNDGFLRGFSIRIPYPGLPSHMSSPLQPPWFHQPNNSMATEMSP